MKKVLASEEYKGFGIDLAEDDDYENYIIYDKSKGKYLGELLNEGQPIAYTVKEAEELIDIYKKKGGFDK